MFFNINIINGFAYNEILTISGDGAGNQTLNGGMQTSWNTVQESATKYFSFTDPSNCIGFLTFGPATGIIVNRGDLGSSGDQWMCMYASGGGNDYTQQENAEDYILISPEYYSSLESGGNITIKFYPSYVQIATDGSTSPDPTYVDQPND